jgi:MFS family permease
MCPQGNEDIPEKSIVPGSLGEPEVGVTPAQLRISTFASLAIPDYRWYWIGLLAYFSAMQMQMVAQGWLVYQITDSAVSLGLVSAALGIPILLFSMFGGVIADQLDKRKIMIVTQIGLSVLMLIIAILVSTNTIRFWHLVIGAFLTGLGFVFNVPARQAIIPELVDRNRLLNSISLNSLGMNVTRIVGPSIAGALMALISISLVYYIVAVLYILAAVSLFGVSNQRTRTPNIRVSDTNRKAQYSIYGTVVGFISRVWIDLKEGISYMQQSRTILLLMAMAFVPLAFGLPYLNLMPVFAKDIFQMGAEGLGFLMAAAGLGAMVGSLIIASLGDFRHKGMLILVLALVFGLSLLAFGLSQNFGLSIATLLIVGSAGAGYMTVNNTLIQSNTDPRMLGRVMSIYMISFSLMPLGTLPIAAVAEMIGVGTAIALGGSIVFIFTAVMTLSQSRIRHLP